MINRVTIEQRTPDLQIKQGPSVVIAQRVVQVTVFSEELAMPTLFEKFDFTAVAGQDEFELPTLPVTMIALYINGVAQNEENGDFSVNGFTLLLNEGVDEGDHVFGVYQKVGA